MIHFDHKSGSWIRPTVDFLSISRCVDWHDSIAVKTRGSLNAIDVNFDPDWDLQQKLPSKKSNFLILLNLEFVPTTLELIHAVLIHTFSSFLARKWTRTG